MKKKIMVQIKMEKVKMFIVEFGSSANIAKPFQVGLYLPHACKLTIQIIQFSWI